MNGGLFGVPGWGFALILAAFAPFAARAWGQWVERRVRERTTRTMQRLERRVAVGPAPAAARGDRP
jgi:hypothetical protein